MYDINQSMMDTDPGNILIRRDCIICELVTTSSRLELCAWSLGFSPLHDILHVDLIRSLHELNDCIVHVCLLL